LRRWGGPVTGREPACGDGELEPAPRPPDLWDLMQAQVDQAFRDFFGGDYPEPWGEDAGSPDPERDGPE